MIIDLFAGAGGASLGMEAAMGRPVDVGINHNPIALAIHAANHPDTRHLCEDIWHAEPREVVGKRTVDLLWASPDCTHFSKAKGGVPREKKIRSLAWVVIKWAKAVRPRVILLENVEEFRTWGPLDAHGHPIKEKSGATFEAWKACLRELGYTVDDRELVAADYGTPTTRKRFFLIARCDGKPIVWPEPTNAPRDKAELLGLLPWRSAAECIDWSIPCPSIFERKKPLAEATLRRVAHGLKRYVLDAADPFVIAIDHNSASPASSTHDARDPVRTITMENRFAAVVPHLHRMYGNSIGQSVGEPSPTECGNAHTALVSAFLAKYHGQKGNESRCNDMSDPLRTMDTENRFGIVTPFLAKHYGGVVGHGVDRTIGTVTSVDHHSLVCPFLAKLYGTSKDGQDARHPLPTITGGGQHVAEVRAFLIKYYSSGGQHQSARDPMHTLTHRQRMGLVTVSGVDYQIVDIGLRMLQPAELLRAQFGRFAGQYVLQGTKSQQVAAIGNSVCPEVAEAIVRANFSNVAEGVK